MLHAPLHAALLQYAELGVQQAYTHLLQPLYQPPLNSSATASATAAATGAITSSTLQVAALEPYRFNRNNARDSGVRLAEVALEYNEEARLRYNAWLAGCGPYEAGKGTDGASELEGESLYGSRNGAMGGQDSEEIHEGWSEAGGVCERACIGGSELHTNAYHEIQILIASVD